ncbi:MAG: MFS transporter [Pseudomonadota bacterium]
MSEPFLAASSDRQEGWRVLAVTTWVQVLCSGGMLLVPTLAPQVAAAFGVPTGWVGLQVSLLYGVAMLTSLQSAVLARRLGGCRASQLAIALVMVGCALALIGSPLALLATTLMLGLAYGITSPAAAELLTRFTSPERRNLVFSIKQTGVPLGGVLAGLLAPPLAAYWNWQAAFLAVSGASLATLLLLQPQRAHWDATPRRQRSHAGCRKSGRAAARPGHALAGRYRLLPFGGAALAAELRGGLHGGGAVADAGDGWGDRLAGACGRGVRPPGLGGVGRPPGR